MSSPALINLVNNAGHKTESVMTKPYLYIILFAIFVLCGETSSAREHIYETYNDTSCMNSPITISEYRQPIFQPSFFCKKKDTIYLVYVYYNSIDSESIDSNVIQNTYLPYNNSKWWITQYDNGDIRICKFRKVRHNSVDFKKANISDSFGTEMEMRDFNLYDENGKLIELSRHFGAFSYYMPRNR